MRIVNDKHTLHKDINDSKSVILNLLKTSSSRKVWRCGLQSKYQACSKNQWRLKDLAQTTSSPYRLVNRKVLCYNMRTRDNTYEWGMLYITESQNLEKNSIVSEVDQKKFAYSWSQLIIVSPKHLQGSLRNTKYNITGVWRITRTKKPTRII